MISKRMKGRTDGKSSASDALRYGAGLKKDRETGQYLDKSHRTRFGNFGLIDNGVYTEQGLDALSDMIHLAALEMQANCDLNNRVAADKKIGHFLISFDQDKPSEAVLRDVEDSMLAAMKLDKNHFSSFLHSDNGHWHLHLFASRIEKEKLHRCNDLWRDKTLRDMVCREVEIRHGLKRDNGLHQIDADGKIVEIPLSERRAKRALNPKISDRAITTEMYSGEKSFQTWASDIRIGDRLKHAKNWQDLHAAAAAYGCEVKQKGAGFVICPAGEAGGIQLSKVGLKNLPAKFGAFQSATLGHQMQSEARYKSAPTQAKAASHYDKWRAAREVFQPVKTDRINAQRAAHQLDRNAVRVQQKAELEKIRAEKQGQQRFAAISIAKMQHTVALAALTVQFAYERQALRKQLAGQGPGNTFRDYLVCEAAKGDDIALELARKYGVEESTDVLRKREAEQLKIVAAISGQGYRPAPRLSFSHRIERNGSVVFDLGQGRILTDSAISRQVQLNDAAANSPEAIATALSFAAAKFGNTLTLTGSLQFQHLAVETAVLSRLGIKFADPALEAYREKFAAEQQSIHGKNHPMRTPFGNSMPVPCIVPDLTHLTPGQVAKGVAHVLTRTLDHGIPPEHVIRAQQHRRGTATERSSRLHELPVSGVDGERQNAGMLLPHTLHGRLGDLQAGQDQAVRRTGESTTGRRRDAATDKSGAAGIHLRGPNVGIVRPAGTGERAGDTSKRRGLPVAASFRTHQQAQRAAAPAAAMPAADRHQVEVVAEPAPQPLSAHTWLEQWAVEENKTIVTATPENSDIAYTVVHVAPDGIVLNKGRSGAVYPVPTDVVLRVGAKVVVDRNGEICLPRTPEQDGGKKPPER